MTPLSFHLVFYLSRKGLSSVPQVSAPDLSPVALGSAVGGGGIELWSNLSPERMYRPQRGQRLSVYAHGTELTADDAFSAMNGKFSAPDLTALLIAQTTPFERYRILSNGVPLSVHGLFTSSYEAVVVTNFSSYVQDVLHHAAQPDSPRPFFTTFRSQNSRNITLNVTRLVTRWRRWRSEGVDPARRFLILEDQWTSPLTTTE